MPSVIAGIIAEQVIGMMVEETLKGSLKDDSSSSSSSSFFGSSSNESPYKYSRMTNYTLLNRPAPEFSLYAIKHTDSKSK